MQIHIFISVLLLCWTQKENENRPDGAIPTSERECAHISWSVKCIENILLRWSAQEDIKYCLELLF